MPYFQQMKPVGNFCILWLLGVSVSNSLSISEEVQQRSLFPSHGGLDSLYYTNSHHRNKREQHSRAYPDGEYDVPDGRSGLNEYGDYDRLNPKGSRRNLMQIDDPFKSTHHRRQPENLELDPELDFPRQKHSLGMKDLDNLPYENRPHSHRRHGEGHRFHDYSSEYSARPYRRARLDQTFDETDGVYRNFMYNEYPFPQFNQHRRSEDRELNSFPPRSPSHRMRHRRHFQPFYEQSEMYNNDYREDLLRYREEKYCQRYPAACSRARGGRDPFDEEYGYPGKTDKRNLMYNQQSPEQPPIDPINPIQMQEFTAALASLTFSDLPKNSQPNHAAKLNKSSQSVGDHRQDTLSAKDTKEKIFAPSKDNSELNEKSNRSSTHSIQSKDAEIQSAGLKNNRIKQTEEADQPKPDEASTVKRGKAEQSNSDQPKPDEASTVKGDKAEQSNSDQPKPDKASEVEDKAEKPNSTSFPEIPNDLKHTNSLESKDQPETIPDSSENKVSSSLDDYEKLKNEQKSTPSPAASTEKVEDTKIEDKAKSEETSTPLNKKEADEQPADPKSSDKEPVRPKSTFAAGSPENQPKSKNRKSKHISSSLYDGPHKVLAQKYKNQNNSKGRRSKEN